MTKAVITNLTETTINTDSMDITNDNFDNLNAQLPDDVDWAIVSRLGTQTITNKTLTAPTITNPTVTTGSFTNPTVSTGTFTSPTLVTPALGTPASGVATNLSGTATNLTSGITNALKSATTTVDVSAATAPAANQVLVATWSTAATWQTYSQGYWDFAVKLDSDFTVTNSATLTDVTGFSFASVAGEVWYVQLMGSCSASAIAGDIKADLITTGTWTNTASFAEWQFYNWSATLWTYTLSAFSGSATAIASLVINNGDGNVRPFMFNFNILVSGSGNIKFQIANNGAWVWVTSTIKAWTYMLARKLSV